jgi:Ribosome inactivating protein
MRLDDRATITASCFGQLAFAVIVAGTCLAGMGTANADVPAGQYTRVYMNVGAQGSQTQQSQYAQLISSLRTAAGHAFRNGVLITNPATGRLIRLTLTDTESKLSLDLWISPDNLYVRGFTASNGQTYEFDDSSYNLYQAMQNNGAGEFLGHGVVLLGYGSDYNDLVRNAGVGRERLNFSFGSFRDAINVLARATGPTGLARSLMLLIQLTSEAARFHDVYGIGANIMLSSHNIYNGLPMLQQRLENQWSAISEYAIRVSTNPSTPPLHVPQVGTFHSFNNVSRRMALLAGAPLAVPGGLSGDWKHTEL